MFVIFQDVQPNVCDFSKHSTKRLKTFGWTFKSEHKLISPCPWFYLDTLKEEILAERKFGGFG